MSGMLYIVATPIGNLGDITLRALETLKMVDIIACEDTRHTLNLLNHYEIKKPLISFHQHSDKIKIDKVIEALKSGQNVALVTDAGTPAISDPGGVLVATAIEEKIDVAPIPGVSALATAVSISGLNLQEFVFVGFLPHKKGRQKTLKALSNERRAVIIYESPYRIKKLFKEISEYFGDPNIVVARELTKKFETIYRGKVSEVSIQIKEKGEFTVIIEGSNGKK